MHDNRFAGTVPSINLEFRGFDESSFISDCGVPSVFDDPLICEGCTMCCKPTCANEPPNVSLPFDFYSQLFLNAYCVRQVTLGANVIRQKRPTSKKATLAATKNSLGYFLCLS